MTQLHWLTQDPAWRERVKALRSGASIDNAKAWSEAVALANNRLDFVRTNMLDLAARANFDTAPPPGVKRIRLAILGSCTTTHLHGAIRVAGLRRGFWIDIYENDYGQYLQELVDADSALHAFRPDVVLVAIDAHHLAAGLSAQFEQADADAAVEQRLHGIAECWRLARQAFNCSVIQQTPLPVHPDLMGMNEHRLPGSPAAVIARINERLRPMADAAGVDLLAVDARAARDGLDAWRDADLWRRAKQEIAPTAGPFFGDMVGRLLAARLGRSFKCLVLDLDNTLWGGVIGDDGMEGIVLGQGSPLGEGYTAFQDYALNLSRRGVILAVCSKNDEANALEPFLRHPEMTLKRGDIAAFVANWSDKPANIKAIASELNIGLDSLVFVDDSPVERALVRQELPMVAVPEVSDDPLGYIRAISDAGYFESVAITREDRVRSRQYQENSAREAFKASTTDMPAYLRGLQMELIWSRFDRIGVQRIVQLINKTNQFNLTTRRCSEADVLAIMQSDQAIGLQFRLKDRFGDNGIIAVCIGRLQGDRDLLIDTWLMSCRVLGRQVEATMLNVIAAEARKLGALRLLGDYVPTKKNAMVRDHYLKLGFEAIETRPDGGSRATLDLARFAPSDTPIAVTES